MGAVIGALNIATLRGRLGDEVSVRLCMVVMGACVAVVAISRSPVLTGSALVFAGAAWTASVTLFNVSVQLAVPRWVAGRALAAYQAAIAGGIALGSWAWGSAANVLGVEGALLISGATLFASPVLGLWMRMPTVSGPNGTNPDSTNVGTPCRICALERGHARSIKRGCHTDYEPGERPLIKTPRESPCARPR